MMRPLLAVLLLLGACQSPCEPPPDVATLDSGWWVVRLGTGEVCIARPYQEPERDTSAEAIAECRQAAGY